MSELDQLLREARLAEPDALDEAGEEALVLEARRAASASALDALVADAQRAELEPLNELDVRRVAQRAAMTGRARHRRWTRRRVMVASGLAAALAAAAVTLALLPQSEPTAAPVARDQAPAEDPSDLELATGDHLVAAAGARYHVELPEPTERSVRLDEGTVLFDVRPIEGGRFIVATPNARVAVLGTIFSVHASARGTTVRVYEGRVEVEGDGRVETRVVRRGGVVHLGEGTPLPDPLADAGEDAARLRLAATATTDRRVDDDGSGPLAAGMTEGAGTDSPGESVSEGAGTLADTETETETDTGTETDTETASASETETASETTPTTPTELSTLLATGRAAQALEAAREAIERGEPDPYRMLEGDALRSLGRIEEAADAYRRAVGELPPPRRQQAGFLEARLRSGELGDPEGALSALRRAGVTAAGSPLRERAMALEAQLHHRLGNTMELRAVAAAYLGDYPNGSRANEMRGYLRE